MSSSGEVLPLGFSARVAQLTLAPVHALLLAKSKVPDPVCRLPFHTTSARRSAVAMSSPICFCGWCALDPTLLCPILIFERCPDGYLDVALEGVRDGADLVGVIHGVPEPFGVEGALFGPDAYVLRRRAALPEDEREGHRVAARVGGGHLGPRGP